MTDVPRLTNQKDLVKARKLVEKTLLKAHKLTLIDAADFVVEEAQMIVPVRTGNLSRSISRGTPKLEPTKGIMSITVGAYTNYAEPVEFGSPPHTIKPKNKKALAWVEPGRKRPKTKEGWKKAQEEGWAFVRKSVYHPGAKPRPYMRPALDRLRVSNMKQFLHKNIRKMFLQVGMIADD